MRALREAGVAGGELDHAIGDLQPLQHRLGVAGHPLVLRVGVLGPREADQLDLVELVHPDQPAGVLAVRAGLAAEARRVGHVAAAAGRTPSRISSRWRLVTGTSAVGMRKRSSAGKP